MAPANGLLDGDTDFPAHQPEERYLCGTFEHMEREDQRSKLLFFCLLVPVFDVCFVFTRTSIEASEPPPLGISDVPPCLK